MRRSNYLIWGTLNDSGITTAGKGKKRNRDGVDTNVAEPTVFEPTPQDFFARRNKIFQDVGSCILEEDF